MRLLKEFIITLCETKDFDKFVEELPSENASDGRMLQLYWKLNDRLKESGDVEGEIIRLFFHDSAHKYLDTLTWMSWERGIELPTDLVLQLHHRNALTVKVAAQLILMSEDPKRAFDVIYPKLKHQRDLDGESPLIGELIFFIVIEDNARKFLVYETELMNTIIDELNFSRANRAGFHYVFHVNGIKTSVVVLFLDHCYDNPLLRDRIVELRRSYKWLVDTPER